MAFVAIAAKNAIFWSPAIRQIEETTNQSASLGVMLRHNILKSKLYFDL